MVFKRIYCLIIWVVFSFGFVTSKNFIQPKPKPFANPVLIYGTSFGNYLQQLYKQRKYDDMLHFTSKQSISKFGSKKILDLYRNMDFGYILKLKNKSSEGDTIFLTYETSINATKRILNIKISVENDSSKIILNSLDKTNPF